MAGPRKRLPTAKQKASSLFCLWHSIQDVKAQAAALRDEELLLLIDMVELLVEDRTIGLAQPAGGKPASRRPQRQSIAVAQGAAAA